MQPEVAPTSAESEELRPSHIGPVQTERCRRAQPDLPARDLRRIALGGGCWLWRARRNYINISIFLRPTTGLFSGTYRPKCPRTPRRPRGCCQRPGGGRHLPRAGEVRSLRRAHPRRPAGRGNAGGGVGPRRRDPGPASSGPLTDGDRARATAPGSRYGPTASRPSFQGRSGACRRPRTLRLSRC
jgi:hypothetical protein